VSKIFSLFPLILSEGFSFTNKFVSCEYAKQFPLPLGGERARGWQKLLAMNIRKRILSCV
jgi:hypothetical protein